MKVFVDTNILIDFVCQRGEFAHNANQLMALGCMGKVHLQTSALSYILEAKIVKEMLSSDWKDYEDATQNATALNASSDCIVTRNKKDFKESSLSVYTVDELFARF